jgi:hypothetical protein
MFCEWAALLLSVLIEGVQTLVDDVTEVYLVILEVAGN